MDKEYLVLCRAIKYKHLGIVDLTLSELWYRLSSKHKLWVMKFLHKNGIIWGNKR